MDIKTKNKITYTSFILACMIIWHHTYNVDVYNLTGIIALIEKILLIIFETAVPVFFMISAFLFYYNADINNIKDKLKRRIFSLIIPYLLWNIIGYLYFQIISLFPFIKINYGGSIEDFSFVGLIKSAFTGEYNLVTWFLRSLIIYTYVLPVFNKLYKNKYLSFIFLVVSFYISTRFRVNNEMSYLVYYIFGIFLAYNYKDIFVKRFSKLFSLLSFTTVVILSVFYAVADINYGSIFSNILYCTMSILLWVSFDVTAIDTKPKWWMNTSFIMFVSHEMILEPIEKIILLVFGSTSCGAIFDYLFAPIFTVTFIIILCKFLKKMPSIYKLLSGNR